ncbi:hypothetical protein FA13DRAFT_1727025 [Coprinellus micaceus]|uniref:Uncharacterized protein n=1 Tax=Coprinellus micaceus TaxID=71717 RepID=A0A4Y7TR49_COPMI|nr:hypothetical protein FA13DRAFT_1727025 [Coprinellus micaceus]
MAVLSFCVWFILNATNGFGIGVCRIMKTRARISRKEGVRGFRYSRKLGLGSVN